MDLEIKGEDWGGYMSVGDISIQMVFWLSLAWLQITSTLSDLKQQQSFIISCGLGVLGLWTGHRGDGLALQCLRPQLENSVAGS